MRIDGNDYSVDPHAIGRFVDWIATPALVAVTCADQLVATHDRAWTTGATITDPAHRQAAQAMRAELATQREHARRATRTHTDGHVVALRALPDYDALFGVDFDPQPTETTVDKPAAPAQPAPATGTTEGNPR